MKLFIDNLVIEVTRRCNMHCAHCMRGDAQNIDLDLDKMRAFLSNVEDINTITFTGGEPTLNVPAITAILKMCKEFNISVASFYIVTNGKKINTAFLKAMIDWYVYCTDCGGEPEYCGVALSHDMYHDKIRPENVAKLAALSFFRPDDKDMHHWAPNLLNLGRARTLHNVDKSDHHYYAPDVNTYDETVSIMDASIAFTVNGDILMDCDYEYENGDKIKIATWDTAVDVFYRAATDPDFQFPETE